MFKAALPQET